MTTIAAGEWVDVEIGSPAWLSLMTASKVAAVLNVTPYDSPRSLWHKMRGDLEREAVKPNQARGHYLEPAILAWFFDQHPELVRWHPPAGTFVIDGWKAISPDALARHRDTLELVVIEAKSDAGDYDWGDPGTDEIPIKYAAQTIWALHVLGIQRAYVPMIGSRLEFAEYVIAYDPELGAGIEDQCFSFVESLTTDEPPAVDAHPETYRALKKVNPLIEDRVVQLTHGQAVQFIEAVAAEKTAAAARTFANSTLVELMGTAKEAKYGSLLIARRQTTKGGASIYPARNLPTREGIEA